MFDIDKYANIFKELGHPIRLKIVKEVIKYGKKGVSVGELQKTLNIPNSTLSHHIAALVSVLIIKQKREGRILRCILELDRIKDIMDFLTKECCIYNPNI